MTSEQVMPRVAVAFLVLWIAGCTSFGRRADPAPLLDAPYATRQVWAVAPLTNESGSLQVDGARMADHLARQFEMARGIDVLPVNRVLAAMEHLQMPVVGSVDEAQQLRRLLNVDGLIVGTVSDYESYDPPKLGLSIELYLDQRPGGRGFDAPVLNVRELTHAATDEMTRVPEEAMHIDGPTNAVSGFFDAADPRVRAQLQQYATSRGGHGEDADAWRIYRISMDLYTEFVSYVVSARLLDAEQRRLKTAEPTTTDPPLED